MCRPQQLQPSSRHVFQFPEHEWVNARLCQGNWKRWKAKTQIWHVAFSKIINLGSMLDFTSLKFITPKISTTKTREYAIFHNKIWHHQKFYQSNVPSVSCADASKKLHFICMKHLYFKVSLCAPIIENRNIWFWTWQINYSATHADVSASYWHFAESQVFKRVAQIMLFLPPHIFDK